MAKLCRVFFFFEKNYKIPKLNTNLFEKEIFYILHNFRSSNFCFNLIDNFFVQIFYLYI